MVCNNPFLDKSALANSAILDQSYQGLQCLPFNPQIF